MYSLKKKVTDKLSLLFADSSNSPSSSSSSPQASPYSKQGRSWSSCLSYVIPSVGLDGSKTSNHRHDLKRGQSVSVKFNYENFDHQNDDSMDKYVDCSPLCISKDFLKNKIYDEDEAFGGSSSSSDVYEEVNSRHSSDSPNKPQLHLTNDSAFISPELNDFFESCLPNIVKGCQRVLLYSTMKHGISLRTLIRKSAELSGPCLLIVGDMQGAVFGGLLECPLKPTAKRKYQGTNQIFVFTTIYGQPRLFRPTGANRYYYLCLSDLLALGGGGSYALCLDEDLLTGTSGPSDTFGNLCLAHSPEFELKNVELWGFTYASPYLMRG